MTIQIDDAGVGDLLHGVVVGAHRKETGEFHYDMIPVSYFQSPSFGRKMYQKKATELALNLLYQMKLGENEEIAFNAGSHTEAMRLAYKDFERLVKPKVLSFTT